jgi:hypothetical protein
MMIGESSVQLLLSNSLDRTSSTNRARQRSTDLSGSQRRRTLTQQHSNGSAVVVVAIDSRQILFRYDRETFEQRFGCRRCIAWHFARNVLFRRDIRIEMLSQSSFSFILSVIVNQIQKNMIFMFTCHNIAN